jgi:hypothetical protein
LNAKLKGYLFTFLFFLTGSLVALYLATRPASQEKIALGITYNLERELTQLDNEALAILQDWKSGSREFLRSYDEFSFFIVSPGRVLHWSDNRFVPNPTSVQGDFQIKLLKEGSSN